LVVALEVVVVVEASAAEEAVSGASVEVPEAAEEQVEAGNV
jgi:hypothetical protein